MNPFWRAYFSIGLKPPTSCDWQRLIIIVIASNSVLDGFLKHLFIFTPKLPGEMIRFDKTTIILSQMGWNLHPPTQGPIFGALPLIPPPRSLMDTPLNADVPNHHVQIPCEFSGVLSRWAPYIYHKKATKCRLKKYIYTLQGTNISSKNGILSRWFSGFPKVGYVSFQEGIYIYISLSPMDPMGIGNGRVISPRTEWSYRRLPRGPNCDSPCATTWRIIPFPMWVISMVSKSSNWGYSPWYISIHD